VPGDYAALRDVDIVIEAVFEDRTVRRSRRAGPRPEMPRKIVVATKYSTLPITGLGRRLTEAEQFIGLHFFSPVPRHAAVLDHPRRTNQ